MSMAKIVDEAIGFLPESIQRELNDAWASGKSSPHTRAVDPLNATLLYRAKTIRGMQMEIAALKAQRDELLSDMQWAVGQLEQLDEANAQMVAVTLRTSAAKHKGASHG